MEDITYSYRESFIIDNYPKLSLDKIIVHVELLIYIINVPLTLLVNTLTLQY